MYIPEESIKAMEDALIKLEESVARMENADLPVPGAHAPQSLLSRDNLEVLNERFAFPFPPKKHQAETLTQYGKQVRHGYGWKPGCVDASTEFLTPTGWKRIDQYEQGDLVAQYDWATGAAQFVQPQRYIKEPCREMYHFKSKYGIDQVLSPDHRVIGMDSRRRPGLVGRPEKPVEVNAQEWAEAHLQGGQVAGLGTGRFAVPTRFSVPPGPGMDISPEDLRLQIAVMADGHFAGRSNRVAIRLKRERKIERLRSLLHDSGRAYKEAVVTKGTAIGFHVFNFEAPIKTKTFGPEFWAMSMEQLTLTALEVTYWDGSATERKKLTTFSFTSVDKASADFVQYVWIATGRSATVSQDKRTEKYRNGTCYTVTRSTTERGGPRGLKTLKGSDGSVSKVPTPDGFMYCFTVPTGMLVLRRGGRTFVTGNCGKTYGTVMHACYLMTIRSARQWIVLVPPIVLRNWSRFLAQVIDKSTGQPVTQTLYAGTPKQRAALSLDSQFILMSYDIFKRDYDKLTKHFDGRRVGLIADEAHKIKNMQSANYKSVWAMFNTQPVLLATGTPITTPDDAYTYMKFTNPLAYRNKRHFEQMHVGERDDYEKVTSWANLDKLKENFLVNWTIPEIVRDNSAPTNFIPIVYDLDSAHLRLYNELVEHQLLEMDDGRVIDALSTSALYHRCQQIICNWGHFEGDTDKTGAGFQLVEEVLDEIGDEKLVVVANYRMTTTGLAQHFKALAPALLIGGMSDAQRYKEIDRFTQDKACRIIIIQPEAGGVGLDGLQAVCNEMIFLECPTIPRQFEQAYARLDREGQVRQVNCRIAVANKTIQIKLHRSLLAKDDTIVKVTGGLKTLREAIHGT